MKNDFVIMFLIAALGYLFGSIKFRGLSLGSSGVLLVALIFGHFGLQVPELLRNFGLILFVSAVGYTAGPIFFQLFSKKALTFIVLGILMVTVGIAVTMLCAFLFHLPVDLSIGMFTGALTSTPGLAVATELWGDIAATGYGIAYPFGVVGVVLFVQLLPKISKIDIHSEVSRLRAYKDSAASAGSVQNHIPIDSMGFFALSIAIVLGMLFSKITIPLSNGLSFSLGTSGGPLLSGLIIGHFGHIGKISLTCPEKTLGFVRELGLILFLMGAGTQAGAQFVAILLQYGIRLFILGALITVIPMIVGYVVGQKLFTLELISTLGAITGGMTSTPALGALIDMSGADEVAAPYAATYPIALISIVFFIQVISLLCL
ncbi:MAG: permease [Eubacteriales bacterium]|nr:permease [Eubacteriales bacterium]